MTFSLPEEVEFIERGFGLSSTHDPQEAIFSYVRAYEGGTELIVTFELGSFPSSCARISHAGRLIAEVAIEETRDISFQSWNNCQILRMNFSGANWDVDMRVQYDPQPSIHMSSREL